MSKLTVRSRIYRAIFEKFLTSKLLRGVRAEEWKKFSSFKEGEISSSAQVIWFHAASAGELESLWPVILASAKQGLRLCVSVFSDSASRSLEKLRAALSAYPGSLLYSGFSPWEGEWEAALRLLRPSVFVTAKYEAWPDLWLSLSLLRIPLVVVGAKARSSFLVCRFLLRALGMPLPELVLLTVEQGEVEALQRIFPAAQVMASGDPRWDQVKARSVGGHPRVAELLKRFQESPRPWGALAQVWKEDLQVWQESLAKLPGTVWVIPHRLDEGTISEISGFLSATRMEWVRSSVSSGVDSGMPKFILLDEMGILLEFYSCVDWAYVGGGMGRGVHSTIEPAIHGIPIAAGTHGAEKFPEIAQLVKSGQLALFQGQKSGFGPQQIEKWIEGAVGLSKATKESWIRDSDRRMGATQEVLRILLSVAGIPDRAKNHH